MTLNRQAISTSLSQKIIHRIQDILNTSPDTLTDSELMSLSTKLDEIAQEILPRTDYSKIPYILITRLPLIYHNNALDLRATRLLHFALGRRLGTP